MDIKRLEVTRAMLQAKLDKINGLIREEELKLGLKEFHEVYALPNVYVGKYPNVLYDITNRTFPESSEIDHANGNYKLVSALTYAFNSVDDIIKRFSEHELIYLLNGSIKKYAVYADDEEEYRFVARFSIVE